MFRHIISSRIEEDAILLLANGVGRWQSKRAGQKRIKHISSNPGKHERAVKKLESKRLKREHIRKARAERAEVKRVAKVAAKESRRKEIVRVREYHADILKEAANLRKLVNELSRKLEKYEPTKVEIKREPIDRSWIFKRIKQASDFNPLVQHFKIIKTKGEFRFQDKLYPSNNWHIHNLIGYWTARFDSERDLVHFFQKRWKSGESRPSQLMLLWSQLAKMQQTDCSFGIRDVLSILRSKCKPAWCKGAARIYFDGVSILDGNYYSEEEERDDISAHRAVWRVVIGRESGGRSEESVEGSLKVALPERSLKVAGCETEVEPAKEHLDESRTAGPNLVGAITIPVVGKDVSEMGGKKKRGGRGKEQKASNPLVPVAPTASEALVLPLLPQDIKYLDEGKGLEYDVFDVSDHWDDDIVVPVGATSSFNLHSRLSENSNRATPQGAVLDDSAMPVASNLDSVSSASSELRELRGKTAGMLFSAYSLGGYSSKPTWVSHGSGTAAGKPVATESAIRGSEGNTNPDVTKSGVIVARGETCSACGGLGVVCPLMPRFAWREKSLVMGLQRCNGCINKSLVRLRQQEQNLGFTDG